jgi:hypothetical protein
MYERMLNKNIIPSENDIKEHIGEKSFENIKLIKSGLGKIFNINLELKFPFGNNYGWGYKFSDGKKHLFYLFFEKNSITIMLQIKRIKTEREIENYNRLSEEGKNYWINRYPCGENGGWIHYRIINKEQLKDIEIFLTIRTNKKIKIYDN